MTGNHYHVVLYLDIERGRAWDRDEVIGRWTRLFSSGPLARAYLRGGIVRGDGAGGGIGEPVLPAPALMPFRTGVEPRKTALAEAVGGKPEAELPFALEDYIELVDWTGRLARPDKKRVVAADAPAALSALGLDAVQWRVLTLEIQKRAMVLFHGLERVKAWERRRLKKAA